MTDSLSGKLVAEPLRRGGGLHCLFHSVFFCCRETNISDCVIVFLDFETTGLSILTDFIVEIGAVCAGGEVFSTVVRPPVVQTSPSVHGIEDAELQEGPDFPEAFGRMVCFLEHLRDTMVSDDESSADELPELPSLKDELPDILIVAHNGMKFDYPMLLSECYRSFLPLDPLGRWKYVDTLSVARALDPHVFGCVKLQCMFATVGGADGLVAHRALDDSIAMKSVVAYIADMFGVPMIRLLSPFAQELDIAASIAQLSSVM